jgi:hypothetical protein
MVDELHADDKPVRKEVGEQFGWPDDGRPERLPDWFVELRDEAMNKLCRLVDDMSSEGYVNSLTYDVDVHCEMAGQEAAFVGKGFGPQWNEWMRIRQDLARLAERIQDIR